MSKCGHVWLGIVTNYLDAMDLVVCSMAAHHSNFWKYTSPEHSIASHHHVSTTHAGQSSKKDPVEEGPQRSSTNLATP